jgi:hypothetical protein
MAALNGTISTGTLAERSPALAGLPASMLDTLAARFRGAGLFLVILDRLGGLAYHDTAAGPFFIKYALPLLRSPVLESDLMAAASQLKTPAAVS